MFAHTQLPIPIINTILTLPKKELKDHQLSIMELSSHPPGNSGQTIRVCKDSFLGVYIVWISIKTMQKVLEELLFNHGRHIYCIFLLLQIINKSWHMRSVRWFSSHPLRYLLCCNADNHMFFTSLNFLRVISGFARVRAGFQILCVMTSRRGVLPKLLFIYANYQYVFRSSSYMLELTFYVVLCRRMTLLYQKGLNRVMHGKCRVSISSITKSISNSCKQLQKKLTGKYILCLILFWMHEESIKSIFRIVFSDSLLLIDCLT